MEKTKNLIEWLPGYFIMIIILIMCTEENLLGLGPENLGAIFSLDLGYIVTAISNSSLLATSKA